MTEEFPKQSRFRWTDAAVLIVLLGVLVGLFLPAVQMPGRSRRIPCTNNLRQLALANQTFCASRDGFPGWAETVVFHEGGSDVRDYTWIIALSPYLDQKPLWGEWRNPQVKSPPQPYLPILWCPAKGSPNTSRPVLSYVANVGLLDSNENRLANGTFLDHRVKRSRVTLTDLVDGASNTIMFSESLDAGEWPEVDKTKIGFGWWKTTTPGPEMRINGKPSQPNSPVPLAHPSSRHPGGVVASFGDGSTRFLSEDIEYRVYIQLLTPDDQQSDMPEEWKRIKLSPSDLP